VPNLLVTATTRYDPRGLNKAKKHISGFEKSVKSLGKAFAGVFAAQKILQFGKASVKAFIADDKSARMLANTLKNVGQAYAATNVEDFIAKLQSATGVLDDNLRPALQTLLVATGDVNKSQDALALALDISANGIISLETASKALAKGFQGNTTALSKMGGAVSKATLATGDMNKITAELTAKYKGSALIAAAGYSGQMDKLAVAAANSKEIIGKGLLNAISQLGTRDGIEGAAKDMEDLATYTADAIRGLGILSGKFKALTGFGLGEFIAKTSLVNIVMAPLAALGKSTVKTGYGQQSPGERRTAVAYAVKSAKLRKEENTLLATKNKATREEAQLKKDQAALDELKKKFDLERIGISAALARATDEETKAKLNAMLAILDGSAAGVKKASEELARVLAEKAAAEAAATLALTKFGTSAEFAAVGSIALATAFAKSVDDVTLAMIVSGARYAAQGAAQMATMLGGINLGGTAQTSFASGITAGNTVAESISGARYAGQAEAQLAAQLAALTTATAALTAAAVSKTPTIVVKTDPTVIVEIVQDAIVTNGRNGNRTVQPGSLAIE